MKKFLMLVPAVMLVTACSTPNDVAMNAEYQRSVAMSEAARMEAIAEIARQGEGGVVAAALLMQQNGGNSNHRAPVGTGDRVASVASAVVPALGNTLVGVGQIAATVYAAEAQKDVALTQSNNNANVAINQSNNDATVTMHTNDTMADIATVTIVNPEVVTSTNTTSTTDVVCITDDTYTCN